MIVVNLIGGLGNQMFQYATARRLAEKHSTILKIDVSEFELYKLHRYSLHCFNIWEYLADSTEIEKLVPEKHKKSIAKKFKLLLNLKNNKSILKEKYFYFDPLVLEASDNVYIDGYWQSEKYFEGISKTIRNHFSFPPFTDNKNKALLELIVHSNSVSIHIRRGDYLKNNLNWSLDIDYYNRAIDLIKEKVNNPIFYIFSDDMHWAEANIKITNSHFINHNKGNDSFRDMQLMSNCKHNIIANSSFSWWGAWLNNNEDKKVIAPNKWLSSMEGTRDIIPDSWIQL